MSQKPHERTALGYLRCAWTAPEIDDCTHTIERLAAQHGLRLAHMLAFDDTEATPNLRLIEQIRLADVDAVVVADLAQIERAMRAVTELCELITPDQVYERGHRWPSLLPADRAFS